jgi:hypothetical protein
MYFPFHLLNMLHLSFGIFFATLCNVCNECNETVDEVHVSCLEVGCKKIDK